MRRFWFVLGFQVALFLEALLSRCAADIFAGRREEESPPLKLLSDASFYEMEAVAKSGTLCSYYVCIVGAGMFPGTVQPSAAWLPAQQFFQGMLVQWLCPSR